MNPQKAVAAALVAASLLLAQPAPCAPAAPLQNTTAPPSVVFVVTKDAAQGAQVEPVAVINKGGALAEPGADAAGSLSVFLACYYRAGAQYRLIYGGAEAGTLTIRAATHAECAPNAASADLDAAAPNLGGNVMALATDGKFTARKQSSRRAPTAAERAAAFGVAKQFLLGKRVSPSAVARGTKTLNLTATDLDGDGREELIGTYVVKVGPQVRDTLFLVAAPGARGYSAALTKYARVKAGEMMDPSQINNLGEGGLGTELYVEQLDADGDGVGEVFTAAVSFEGTTYRAYRRERGAWRAVYEHYGYRCAY